MAAPPSWALWLVPALATRANQNILNENDKVHCGRFKWQEVRLRCRRSGIPPAFPPLIEHAPIVPPVVVSLTLIRDIWWFDFKL
ncbi:hypothetical protein H4582DRAFT_1949797 [Lactarius indigo]|nr:hypothetical protein H4582DRAFT_1949797 [Lactarius indigo]